MPVSWPPRPTCIARQMPEKRSTRQRRQEPSTEPNQPLSCSISDQQKQGWGIRATTPRSAVHSLKEESDTAEERVGPRAFERVVLDLLIGRLQHEIGRREDREPDRMELQLPGTGRL